MVVTEAVDLLGRSLGARIAGPFDPAITDLLVQADEAHAVAGHVIGPDGTGVADVRIRAVPVHNVLCPADEDPPPGESHGAAITDAEGRFEVSGLGSGEYVLWTDVSLDWVYPPLVRVKADATEVEVKLALAVRAVVTVLDPDGRPVAGAEVAVFERQHKDGVPPNQLHLYTDPKGRTPFVGLDPDRPYWIMVKPPPDRDDLGRSFLEVPDWKPKNITLRFNRAR